MGILGYRLTKEQLAKYNACETRDDQEDFIRGIMPRSVAFNYISIAKEPYKEGGNIYISVKVKDD